MDERLKTAKLLNPLEQLKKEKNSPKTKLDKQLKFSKIALKKNKQNKQFKKTNRLKKHLEKKKTVKN